MAYDPLSEFDSTLQARLDAISHLKPTEGPELEASSQQLQLTRLAALLEQATGAIFALDIRCESLEREVKRLASVNHGSGSEPGATPSPGDRSP